MNKFLSYSLFVILLSFLFITNCRKQVSILSDTSQNADTSFHEVNPFANVDTSGGATFKEAQLSEALAQKAKGALQTIFFDYNSYQLSPEAIERLQIIAQFLKENAGLRLLIAGHCDERGSSEFNMGLGENRAKVVKEYLLNIGVQPVRLETTSYGKEQPSVTDCHEDMCHSKNRRDEFKVLAR
jgi:peptidoglycan-associated lipoprotein